MIKIALAQINPWVGDFKGNADKIMVNIRKARRKKVDLIVFPELALTGYPPQDLLLKSHFIDQNLRWLRAIKNECEGIIAVVGFVDREKKRIYNSCALIENRKIKDIYHKVNLPNYGVFDEKRYFTQGNFLSFYTLGDYKFCVTICGDIWKEEFTDFLKEKGLNFIINSSASPYHRGKVFQREKILSQLAQKTRALIFYCNLVGAQDELVFDGTSKVFSCQGELIKCASRFKEDFLIFNVNGKQHCPKSIAVKEEEEVYSALCLGLFDYVRKNGFKKVVVGVSGGIDSAVVVSLARLSLGKNKTCALIMPSRYTSSETFRDAKKICENLGIKYYIVRMDEIFQCYLKNLSSFFKGRKQDKTEENLQARIRGNILMAFSNKFGYLVLNTGNKSEVSCGYCTLYGDMVGGFSVLGDTPKLMVYKLGDYINKIMGRSVIPLSVMRRPPSAELKSNQKDTDTLPSYQVLDPILKLYIEENYSEDKIVKAGFRKNLVKRVIKMVDSQEYKRRQAPVGIKITPCSFGKDRRMPITNKFFS